LFTSQRMGLVTGILAVASIANADTILQYTVGIGGIGGPLVEDQSFTTPSGGPRDDITHNFSDGRPAAYANRLSF